MNREEALALCNKYEVEITANTIVTAAGNIYQDGNVDPGDKTERIAVGIEPVKEPSEQDGETKKERKKK